MLKESSKRRRTKAQIKADKLAEANREADIQEKLEKIGMVENKLSRYDNLYQQLEQHKQVLSQMQ